MPLRTLALAALTLLLAGCPGAAPGASPSDSEVRPSPTSDPMRSPLASHEGPRTVPPEEGGAGADGGSVPDDLMADILADAAERSGVDESTIEVVRAVAVTWSDGSLDCPEPGMVYTQALVDGYHVVLDAEGEELDYRATANGGYRLCETPISPPAGG